MAKKKPKSKRPGATDGAAPRTAPREKDATAEEPTAPAPSEAKDEAASPPGDVADDGAVDGADDGAASAPTAAPAPTASAAAPAAPAGDDRPVEVRIGAPVPRLVAPWGEPFARVARALDWFEMRLLFAVLIGLVFLLTAWVSLVGMSAPLESDSSEGGVFRAIVGAVVLGGLSRVVTGRLGWSETRRAIATCVAIALAVAVAPLWRTVGVEYFGHLKTWLQEGSSLTMLGGLRGVGTRVTILLALVGGSLAAAGGKHINIDVVLRFTPDRLKVPVFALSTTATAAVLLAASWGFFDYIAIESFNYRPSELRVQEEGQVAKPSTAREEIAWVQKRVSQHLFLFRRQVGLDLSAVPHVLGGGKWDDPSRMTGRSWNTLVEEGGFRDVFTKEEVDGVRSLEEDLEGSRIPLVVVPGGGSARNLLIPTMNLMFPIGFVIIALRFLLRLVLVLSRHETLEDDVAASAEAADGRATGVAGKAEAA